MGDTTAINFQDGHEREVTREIEQMLDVRDYLGTPGYSLLVMAANRHLALSDVERFLAAQAETTPGVAQSANWLQRRRRLFQVPGTRNPMGRADRDGQQARAVAIMAEHPRKSLYDLRYLLNQHGITRSLEWIRRHRCDGALTTTYP